MLAHSNLRRAGPWMCGSQRKRKTYNLFVVGLEQFAMQYRCRHRHARGRRPMSGSDAYTVHPNTVRKSVVSEGKNARAQCRQGQSAGQQETCAYWKTSITVCERRHGVRTSQPTVATRLHMSAGRRCHLMSTVVDIGLCVEEVPEKSFSYIFYF